MQVVLTTSFGIFSIMTDFAFNFQVVTWTVNNLKCTKKRKRPGVLVWQPLATRETQKVDQSSQRLCCSEMIAGGFWVFLLKARDDRGHMFGAKQSSRAVRLSIERTTYTQQVTATFCSWITAHLDSIQWLLHSNHCWIPSIPLRFNIRAHIPPWCALDLLSSQL